MTKQMPEKIKHKEILNKEEASTYDWSKAVHLPKAKYESKLISIRLPMPMISSLRVSADARNMGYQQLIKQYITDGLQKDNLTISFPTPQTGAYSPFVVMASSDSASVVAQIPLSPAMSGDYFLRAY